MVHKSSGLITPSALITKLMLMFVTTIIKPNILAVRHLHGTIGNKSHKTTTTLGRNVIPADSDVITTCERAWPRAGVTSYSSTRHRQDTARHLPDPATLQMAALLSYTKHSSVNKVCAALCETLIHEEKREREGWARYRCNVCHRQNGKVSNRRPQMYITP